MKRIEVKCIQPYFDKVVNGEKTFEVRLNDRDYQEGDVLVQHEYNPNTQQYTGRYVWGYIGYVLDNETFCKKGYVIFSFLKSSNGFPPTSKKILEKE